MVIERHTQIRWSSGAGRYSEDYFVPLKLKDADVEELFPNLGTTTLNGSSQILKSLLSSPNKNKFLKDLKGSPRKVETENHLLILFYDREKVLTF